MTYSKLICTFLLLLMNLAATPLAASPVEPQNPTAMIRDKNIMWLLEKSGFIVQIKNSIDSANQMWRLNAKFSSDETAAELMKIIAEEIKFEKMLPSVKRYFVESYDGELANRTMKFYTTKAAIDITALEIESSKDDFEARVKNLSPDSVDEKFLEKVRNFQKGMNFREKNKVMLKAILGNVLRGMVKSGVIKNPPKDEEIEKQTETAVQAIDAQTSHVFDLRAYIVYRDAPEKEFDEYIAFCLSEPGKWFNDTGFMGLVKGFETCFDSATIRIGEYIMQKAGKKKPLKN